MENTAPVTFQVVGKSITLPTDASRLPGLSPAAVDMVLDITNKYSVDPKSVDMMAANQAQARFAVEISVYSVAETLRRMDGAKSIEQYVADLRADNDFEDVANAFKLVAARNEAVFGKKGEAKAPVEATQGN